MSQASKEFARMLVGPPDPHYRFPKSAKFAFALLLLMILVMCVAPIAPSFQPYIHALSTKLISSVALFRMYESELLIADAGQIYIDVFIVRLAGVFAAILLYVAFRAVTALFDSNAYVSYGAVRSGLVFLLSGGAFLYFVPLDGRSGYLTVRNNVAINLLQISLITFAFSFFLGELCAQLVAVLSGKREENRD